jgi:hypothetical protein
VVVDIIINNNIRIMVIIPNNNIMRNILVNMVFNQVIMVVVVVGMDIRERGIVALLLRYHLRLDLYRWICLMMGLVIYRLRVDLVRNDRGWMMEWE